MLQSNNTIFKKICKTNVKKKVDFSSALLSIAIIVVMILLLINPTRYAISVTNGLKLFFTAVLPGLLPFMFFTKLLTNSSLIPKLTKPFQKSVKKLFGISAEGIYAFIMSIISGYPIGSKITADLYQSGKISKNEVTKTAILSSTSGPIFVIGAVGGAMLQSTLLGLVIYISNVVAVILCSLIINILERKVKSKKKEMINATLSQNTLNSLSLSPSTPQQQKSASLSNIALDTVMGLLVVGFFVAIFSLFIDLLTDIKAISFFAYPLKIIFEKLSINPELAEGIMSGIIEMTNGANILSKSITPLSISFISFIIAFSGFSIIMQSLSFLNKCPISALKFILAKMFQAVLSFIICLILTCFIL